MPDGSATSSTATSRSRQLPIIPGHEIVGRVERLGEGLTGLRVGDRVGIPWLGRSCGHCRYCKLEREHLCERARFTGYQFDGGFAEYTVADAAYCFALPDCYSDIEAAPLLCAGLIGYRALRMTGDAERVGICGFGAAGHLVVQVARHQGRDVLAFTRPGDSTVQEFALSLGCSWAGDLDVAPPRPLDAAILLAPVGRLVPLDLKAVVKGGTVVLGGIRMSEIPAMPHELRVGRARHPLGHRSNASRRRTVPRARATHARSNDGGADVARARQ